LWAPGWHTIFHSPYPQPEWYKPLDCLCRHSLVIGDFDSRPRSSLSQWYHNGPPSCLEAHCQRRLRLGSPPKRRRAVLARAGSAAVASKRLRSEGSEHKAAKKARKEPSPGLDIEDLFSGSDLDEKYKPPGPDAIIPKKADCEDNSSSSSDSESDEASNAGSAEEEAKQNDRQVMDKVIELLCEICGLSSKVC